MDRFVVKKGKGATSSSSLLGNNVSGDIDLLSILLEKKKQQEAPLLAVKQERGGKRKGEPTISPRVIPSSTTPNDAYLSWSSRESDVVSLLDVKCEQRVAQLKAKNYTGWKLDKDGQRVYTTFRSGERVAAGGREGFLLALGDGAIKKNDKSTDEKGNKEDKRRKRVRDAVVDYVENADDTIATKKRSERSGKMTDFLATKR